MSNVSYVRLKKYDKGVETDLDIALIGSEARISNEVDISRFDPTIDYPANSLVAKDGDIYLTEAPFPAGVWNKFRWDLVEGRYAIVTLYNQDLEYEPDSIVIHPRRDEVYYTANGSAGGDWNDEEWVPLLEVEEITSAIGYLNPLIDSEEAESISARPVPINDYPTDSDSFLNYFDAWYSCIDPANMALNPDGTGTPIPGQRVQFLRDLTGNGNHAIQEENDDAPFYMESSPGVGYLWFRGKQHFKVPTITHIADQYVGFGARGVAYFNGIDNDDWRGAGARVGIRWEGESKDWRIAGQGIISRRVRPEEIEKAKNRLHAYVANVPSGHINVIAGMFENEDRLVSLEPGFNHSGSTFDRLFKNCKLFQGGISDWSVQGVTSMNETFYNCNFLEDDLSNWNVSNVARMMSLFEGCYRLNFDISRWNTAKVFDMSFMFKYATSFDNLGMPLLQDIGMWNTSAVTTTEGMFHGADRFNSMVHNWRMDNVENATSMFQDAKSFNQNISGWSFRRVLMADNFLNGAESFDQDLSRWCADGLLEAPVDFATDSPIEDDLAKYPRWGGCSLPAVYGIYDYTNPGNMADYADQTGAIRDGDRVLFVEDLSGNGFHAIQPDEVFAPIYRELEPGRGYLEFVGDQHLIVPDVTDSVHIATGFADQGSAEFRNVTGSTRGTKLGIRNPNTDKVWELTSEVLAPVTVDPAIWTARRQEVEDLAVATTLPVVPVMIAKFADDRTFNGFFNQWKLRSQVDLSKMFMNCYLFNQDISYWNTSAVINMKDMFSGCNAFNADISGWDVSKCTNFSGMFRGCSSFNRPIGTWNVVNAKYMDNMFTNAIQFNYDIAGWRTGNCLNFNNMFNGAASFNKTINFLDFSSAVEIWGLMRNCSSWNNAGQDLELDCKEIENLSFMFQNCVAFNQPIDKCNFSSVRLLSNTFEGASAFNQDVSVFDGPIHVVTAMFKNASSFNQDVGVLDFAGVTSMFSFLDGAASWTNDGQELILDTSACTDMRRAFAANPSFNLRFDGLDLSNVVNYTEMLRDCINFNQPITNWRPSGNVKLNSVFRGCKAFDQDISNIDVSESLDIEYILEGCTAFTGTGLPDWTIHEEAYAHYAFANTSSLVIDLTGWTSFIQRKIGIFENSAMLAHPDLLPAWA